MWIDAIVIDFEMWNALKTTSSDWVLYNGEVYINVIFTFNYSAINAYLSTREKVKKGTLSIKYYSSDPVTDFEVYYSTDNSNWTLIKSINNQQKELSFELPQDAYVKIQHISTSSYSKGNLILSEFKVKG